MQPNLIQSGTVIDRYTVDGVIGEGGMAIVFRVHHNALGTVHALKVLTVSSAGIRDRLRQEGRFQAKLQHPNIVAVTDVLEVGGTDGLILEYVDGPSLDRLMHDQRLTWDQIDALVPGILAGVAAAHREGVIHRDLKPANVLLKPIEGGYLPKVADFGLAKAFGGSDPGMGRTRTGATMGTPHYMSPEQVRDAKNVGPRSDLFALGAILYEMVCAKRAFGGEDLLDIFNAIATGRYTPIRELAPDAPERMVLAIHAALQVDPQQRPETVEALAALWGVELNPFMSMSMPPSFAASQSVRAIPPESRTWAAETLAGEAAAEAAAEALRSTPPPSSASRGSSSRGSRGAGAASRSGVRASSSPPSSAPVGAAWAVGVSMIVAVLLGIGVVGAGAVGFALYW
ncbi:MAG: serine/threonine-protein kinase, partial [Myxococcota bacterium]